MGNKFKQFKEGIAREIQIFPIGWITLKFDIRKI
jgi:hypothetical protein